MGINYNCIYHFLTVVKYLNINQAAKELYITQPALSLSISRFEKELGFPLFYRDKGKLSLTENAVELLPYCQQMYKDSNQLQDKIEELQKPQVTTIRLCFSGSEHLFSSLYVSDFLTAYEDADIQMSFVSADQVLPLLLQNQIDIAISSNSINHLFVTSERLYHEPIGIVLPKAHPLSGAEFLTPEQISAISFITLYPTFDFRRLIDELTRESHLNISYAYEYTYPEYDQQIIRCDPRYGFFSTRQNFEDNFCPTGEYCFLEVQDVSMERVTSLSYLISSHNNVRYADFIKYLKQTLTEFRCSSDTTI